MGDAAPTAYLHMTTVPTGLRIAQVVGLTSTAFLAGRYLTSTLSDIIANNVQSGKTFTQTFSAVPALLHAPAPLLAKQWKTMFDSDKLLAPLIVAYSSAVFGWMAYRGTHTRRRPSAAPKDIHRPRNAEPTDRHRTEPTSTTHSSLLHLSSLTLLLATIPYSLLLLEPLNQRLEDKASNLATSEKEEVGIQREETTHWLVDRWATVNLGRAVMSAVSAGMAIWAGVEGVKMAGVRVVSGGERMGL